MWLPVCRKAYSLIPSCTAQLGLCLPWLLIKERLVLEQPFVWSCLLTISKSSEGIELKLSTAVSPVPYSLSYTVHSILMLVLLEDVLYTYTHTIMQWERNTEQYIICQSLQLLHNIFLAIIFNNYLVRRKNTTWIKLKWFHIIRLVALLRCSWWVTKYTRDLITVLTEFFTE